MLNTKTGRKLSVKKENKKRKLEDNDLYSNKFSKYEKIENSKCKELQTSTTPVGFVNSNDVLNQMQAQQLHQEKIFEQRNDFFKIDSAYTMRESIKLQVSKVWIIDGEESLDSFFQDAQKLKSLTHIFINTKTFPYVFQNNLTNLIRTEKGITAIYIDVDTIELTELLLNDLRFYSSLEYIMIKSKFYMKGGEYGRAQYYDYKDVESKINVEIRNILILNNKTKLLIHDLTFLWQELKKYNISPENQSLDGESLKYAIFLGEHFNKFEEITSFHQVLYREIEHFKDIYSVSHSWNIINVVKNASSKLSADKFNKVISSIPNFDINQRYSTYDNNKFERLIDIAVQCQSRKIVEALIARNCDITCVYEENISHLFFGEEYDLSMLNNFPFWCVFRDNTYSEMKDIILQDEICLYDGLAWLIVGNKGSYFKELIKSKNIDLNKTIPQGVFKDFSLLQLIVYFHRSNLFLDLHELNLFDGELLVNSIYPNNTHFHYLDWSVLALIVFKGYYCELQVLLPKNVKPSFISLKDKNSLQLLFEGAASLERHDKNRLEKLETYKSCLRYILQFENVKNSLAVLILHDKGSQGDIPVLYFAILHDIFYLIQDYLCLFPMSTIIRSRVHINKYQCALSLLQLSVIEDKIDAFNVLYTIYLEQNALDVIDEPLSVFDNINLFQFSIIHQKFYVFDKFVEYEKCPINVPFPDNHSQYPNWLPLQVVLLKGFTDLSGDFLQKLLKKVDLDITHRFIGKGIPHFLVGYYPTSAVFFSGNPIKNRHPPYYILSDNIYNFFSLIDKLDSKKAILNEALFFAVLHHNVTNDHDHRKHIQALIEKGAYPYQCCDEEGNRIIDLAARKGLLSSFPSGLEEIPQLSPIVLNDNQKESELSTQIIIENHCSVISLVRNKNSRIPEHVFIVVEQIIRGKSVMHFIDFVNIEETKKGRARHKTYEGKIIEPLLYSCKEKLMNIQENDKSCLTVKSWTLNNETTENILSAIDMDKGKIMDYSPIGDQSLFAASSGKKGHNCYTWAREKLLLSNSPRFKEELKTTLEEWLIGAIPSIKEGTYYQKPVLIFSVIYREAKGYASRMVNNIYSQLPTFRR